MKSEEAFGLGVSLLGDETNNGNFGILGCQKSCQFFKSLLRTTYISVIFLLLLG